MNKLDYSISLRVKGLDAADIKRNMKERGFTDSEIKYYLKKSDEIFLNQSVHYKGLKPKSTNKRTIKTIAIMFTLLLLLSVLFGYVKIGLLGLVFLWGIVGFITSRK